MKKEACRKRELLSLIGKLSQACKVVVAGRTFLRRMIDLSCKAKQLDHWIRLTQGFRSDLAWWSSFIERWNGRSMMEVHAGEWRPGIHFSADASGTWGCGAVWHTQWIQCPWNDTWQQECIATKELLPIVLACAIWGPQWSHSQVQVQCDNLFVVHTLRTLTSKNKTTMHLLRCMHFFCAI